MLLSDVIRGIQPVATAGTIDGATVSGIQFDSRRVTPGDLFVAVPGLTQDGARFISDAVKRGAAAVLGAAIEPDVSIPQIAVGDVRAGMAVASRNFFGDPASDMALIGITGTNGKTTTAYLIRHVLNDWNVPCGMLGTIENDLGDAAVSAGRTTPESVDIHRYLSRMRRNGMMAAVLEVSSHALVLKRVHGLNFNVGVFTNLTQDHLDFHQTMQEYQRAKGLLFKSLNADACAVLNRQQFASVDYSRNTAAKVLTYNAYRSGDLCGRPLYADIKGTRFRLHYRKRTADVAWSLVGLHNIENALAAAGACLALGMPLERIAKSLSVFPGVPGRLEPVAPRDCPFAVYVDYAHTDDALARVLDSIRALNPSRVITVFGCGGDRDAGKRPKMARAAQAGSNIVIVTSDNPRTEDPAAIIDDIMAGVTNRGRVIVQPDRHEAIRKAIGLAAPGDVVLIAGKGHETYQIFADHTDSFDDRRQAHQAIADRYDVNRSPAVSGQAA